MANKQKQWRPSARLPKGFRDIGANETRRLKRMLAEISDIYESYGFEPLETPAFEYTDALGKFLPDTDRPNAGVFSLQDEDQQWMSLRYDMTAPLARHVAQHYQHLAKPYRRYTSGPVWRNEKPGPGRYRQFLQFDADTVGTANIAADAEICMLAADTMERLGFPRGDYIISVNNRKVLDGVLAGMGIDPASPDQAGRRLVVLRALDKLDRLGIEGVRQLLGPGRRDDSGDFTTGAELEPPAIDLALRFVQSGAASRAATIGALQELIGADARGLEGIAELRGIDELLRAADFREDRVVVDPSVVRGLDYYTGPVFEAELTFEVKNEDGETVRFGAVGGGGRYDDLVARFTGQAVPATGFSLGVSRLLSALMLVESNAQAPVLGPVVVLVMDRDQQARYQAMVQQLRAAGIRAEMYLGTSGMKAQMKYADKRGAPCVVIQGSDERASAEVQIKDLFEGSELAKNIADHAQWRTGRPAQFSVPQDELVSAVQQVLERYQRPVGSRGANVS